MSQLGKWTSMHAQDVMLWRYSEYRSKAASHSCSLASLLLHVVWL